MDVAIFGAGVAGLTSAITLHAQGERCRIYERTRLSHEAGMGFILMPEGIACLESFGVRLTGVPLDRYRARDASGRVLQQQAMPAGSRGLFRRELIACLMRALPDESTPAFEVELEALEFDAAGSVTAARMSSGERVRAELYVAADGIHSRARETLFPGWPAGDAQVLEVVGISGTEDVMRWAAHDFNKFHAAGGGGALGVLPVDAEHVVWFVQFDAQRFPPPDESAESRRAFAEKMVGDWGEPVPAMLAATDFSRVYVWRPVDSDPVPHFHQGNLVLVGDAAHPLSPFTSQGVSSAIADAVALAEAVRQPELQPALAAYTRRRREQCAPYVAQGRELVQRFLAPRGENVVLPIAK
ncbi:MAG TPA: NAD(P)/FAD-dependent oxidoreductase [Terriglobales bacterium]|jgi:2-polyprenyl-6-methoxyphenol hydroxylase-like FAD-dependent oxidoreductase|nr:NAD(P)/FAD-dependent oxidoreductase [Terriglobales bacterium]